MSRELRQPLRQAEFNKLPLKVLAKRLVASWWNLRWAKNFSADRIFFASSSGRLTPESRSAPCLYLARTRETAFYEIYGDDIDGAEKRGMRRRFLQSELENRIFLRTTEEISVRLYDLSAEKGAHGIGMDLGTLYSPNVVYPRAFAQRLHDHPAGFDGIQYVSRHTQATCIVLWASRRPALRGLTLEVGPSLWDMTRYERDFPPGEMKLFSSSIKVAARADP